MATAITTPAPIPATLDDEARARLATEYEQVAERLHAEFDHAVGADEVSDRLSTVIARYEHATVLNFVPVLVEREVRTVLKQSASTAA